MFNLTRCAIAGHRATPLVHPSRVTLVHFETVSAKVSPATLIRLVLNVGEIPRVCAGKPPGATQGAEADKTLARRGTHSCAAFDGLRHGSRFH